MAKAAGSRLLLCAVAAAGCGGGESGGRVDARPPDSFDRQAMMANLAGEVIYPTYQAFAGRAGELAAAVDAWCAALEGDGETPALDAARAVWRTAMAEWQIAEMMLVGPAAMDSRALRDDVYSWPATSACAVDQEVEMRRGNPAGYDIASRTVQRRGLDALEYVLFTTSLDHTCPSQVAPAGWNELPEPERRAARCGYAAAAASAVLAAANQIERGWSPEGGNYLAELSAGSGSALSPQQAANLLSDAMFYLDTDTKDMKLGEPAGIVMSALCPLGDPCPAELESPHAWYGRENVVANLRGFRMLMSGDREQAGDRLGFEDFLRGLGGGELADDMMADIDAAIAAADAIPIPLEEAIVEEPGAVAGAHAAVKAVTDNLKSQFLTILGLDAPDDAAGDND
jgi:predicted lipoprotein